MPFLPCQLPLSDLAPLHYDRLQVEAKNNLETFSISAANNIMEASPLAMATASTCDSLKTPSYVELTVSM